jgi:hypothetical protein
MLFSLTLQDILTAAGLALVLTWLLKFISHTFRLSVTRSAEYSFSPKHLESVLERCYMMFPMEHVRFKGVLFRRGMQVRVTTLGDKNFEGQFIGVNEDNMICFVSHLHLLVIAQTLDAIGGCINILIQPPFYGSTIFSQAGQQKRTPYISIKTPNKQNQTQIK